MRDTIECGNLSWWCLGITAFVGEPHVVYSAACCRGGGIVLFVAVIGDEHIDVWVELGGRIGDWWGWCRWVSSSITNVGKFATDDVCDMFFRLRSDAGVFLCCRRMAHSVDDVEGGLPMEVVEREVDGGYKGQETPLSPVSANMDIPRRRGQVGSHVQQSTSQYSSPGVLYGSSVPAGMVMILCCGWCGWCINE